MNRRSFMKGAGLLAAGLFMPVSVLPEQAERITEEIVEMCGQRFRVTRVRHAEYSSFWISMADDEWRYGDELLQAHWAIGRSAFVASRDQDA